MVQSPSVSDVLEGRWRIEKKLGSGSMGTVFAAWDLQGQQKVAVKILSPELCRKPPFIARFEREARLMAELKHPNLIALLGIGRRGALPYIVMPYLDGLTLTELLAQRMGKLAPPEAHNVLRQVCAGLGQLHRQKLVHRDVKPQNIFLAPNGHVTLLDLGVARDQTDPGLTRPGVRIGTPYYMAPEQILGDANVDHRADIYALGAVVFELLTGSPPFVGQSHHEVLRAHREDAPPDASQLSPLVSRSAAEIITQALAKNPRDRFQSAGDFLEALENTYDFAFDSEEDQTSPDIFARKDLSAVVKAAVSQVKASDLPHAVVDSSVQTHAEPVEGDEAANVATNPRVHNPLPVASTTGGGVGALSSTGHGDDSSTVGAAAEPPSLASDVAHRNTELRPRRNDSAASKSVASGAGADKPTSPRPPPGPSGRASLGGDDARARASHDGEASGSGTPRAGQDSGSARSRASHTGDSSGSRSSRGHDTGSSRSSHSGEGSGSSRASKPNDTTGGGTPLAARPTRVTLGIGRTGKSSNPSLGSMSGEILDSGFDLVGEGSGSSTGEASARSVPGRQTEPETGMGEIRVLPLLDGVAGRAEVFCDGEQQGVGACTLLVTAGVHELRVQRSGYVTKTLEVEVSAGERAVIKVALEPDV